ncbi:unnamed protein product [Fraxinus pennsylvanica]|uniref:Bromo domain-containing protein n=1 Tax=Fraxinus pennsylvanica TaxID=56036 RepID=A0AAD2DV04_9LAMI|nr:unnamed protein product [Fraxinus pennsylvanica]
MVGANTSRRLESGNQTLGTGRSGTFASFETEWSLLDPRPRPGKLTKRIGEMGIGGEAHEYQPRMRGRKFSRSPSVQRFGGRSRGTFKDKDKGEEKIWRDTYEIFVEPVDADEVEDYCEIIKEPMDFATMRAKLHEGMYQNLEQFKAWAIHKLAKEAFHILRINPENFVSEFSGTRRRSMRKVLSLAKDSSQSNVKVSNVRSEVSSKRRLCSSSQPSVLMRTTKENPGCTGVAAHNESGYYNSFAGSRDGRMSGFVDTNCCSTYRQWRSSLHNKDDSVGSNHRFLSSVFLFKAAQSLDFPLAALFDWFNIEIKCPILVYHTLYQCLGKLTKRIGEMGIGGEAHEYQPRMHGRKFSRSPSVQRFGGRSRGTFKDKDKAWVVTIPLWVAFKVIIPFTNLLPSSDVIQAWAIHKLAKEVFHILRINPENFVSEFSGTRRRSMRKVLSVAKDSSQSNVRVSNVRSEVSSKRRLCSSSQPSVLMRTTKENPGCTGVAAHNESGYYNSFTGSRDGRMSGFVDINCCSTYRQRRSSLHNKDDSVGSKPLILCRNGGPESGQKIPVQNRYLEPAIISGEAQCSEGWKTRLAELGLTRRKPKRGRADLTELGRYGRASTRMNRGYISYRDSLMSFIKDLGSIAQMVAKWKLLGRHKFFLLTIHQIQMAGFSLRNVRFPQHLPVSKVNPVAFDTISTTESGKYLGFIPGSQPFHRTDNIIDLTDAEDGEEANDRNRRENNSIRVEEKTEICAKSAMQSGLNIRCISKHDKVSQTRKKTESRKGSCSFNSFPRDLNSPTYWINMTCTRSTTITVNAGKPDDNVLPLILALENSHSVLQELKSRNKKSSVPSTWTSQTSEPRASSMMPLVLQRTQLSSDDEAETTSHTLTFEVAARRPGKRIRLAFTKQ